MAMRNLIEGLRRTGGPRDLRDAGKVAAMLIVRGSDLSSFSVVVPEETKLPSQEFRLFTDQERTALKKDNAYILSLIGEGTQGESFRYMIEGGSILFELPPIRMEVGIYMDPGRFPTPDRGERDSMTKEQLEQLAEKDSQELRKRLGIEDDSLGVIIPDPVSTLTELIRKYLDETPNRGVRIQALAVGHTANLFNGNAKAADEADHPHASTLDGVAGPGDHAIVLNLDTGILGRRNFPVVRLVVAKKK